MDDYFFKQIALAISMDDSFFKRIALAVWTDDHIYPKLFKLLNIFPNG